jgi:hypothetical protein
MVEVMSHEELFKLLFSDLRSWSDSALETYRIYLARELVEAELKPTEEWYQEQYKVWLRLIDDEKQRRQFLAEYGAPDYAGTNRVSRELVLRIKQHFLGAAFAALFKQLTTYDIFPQPGNHTRMRYRCGMHPDSNPSGMLYLDQGTWHCFSCHAGGDVFTLCQVFCGRINFIEAVQKLAEMTGVR